MSAGIRILQTDPRAAYLAHRAEIDDAWRRVMESGRYVLGPEVDAFEREFAEYLGARFGVSTASGTDAIELALRAIGVGPGDGVLTVSHTAIATVSAIVQCGASPLFVDIDAKTFTMDANRLENLIGRHRVGARLKAIVPVHLYGHPADLPAIVDIARRHELFVVEDCAQSHGAAMGGRKTGTWGDLAAFSFYPTKNLGAFGDGGMIVTGSEELTNRCRSLCEYGWDANRVSQTHGQNSRLDELQAAILRVKLRHLDTGNARRSRLASIYDRLLDRTALVLPTTRAGAMHAYHQYVARTPSRDRLRIQLRQHGIESAVHYSLAVHQHPAYQTFAGPPGSLPETERAAAEVLSLPMYPQLSDREVEFIGQTVDQVVCQ
jgi:dTDP-4-amino-4,6-dideoxygalactose transaminase